MKIKTLMGRAQSEFGFVFECAAEVGRKLVLSYSAVLANGKDRETEGRYAEWLEWAAPLSGSGVVVNGGGK